ncbi:two-component system sensor histidine kinase CreC [Verrucomicrobiales bacterium BCK34]|nr:two-component system sensor histidine kinase CreC [Verrucomicrobiales bacterium BCK34]
MKTTFFMVAGFLLIAGGGFFGLMKTIRNDVERQYSQASEEPLVDMAHLFASLLEEDVRDGVIDVSGMREGFESAYKREFVAQIYQIRKTEIQTHVYVTNAEGIVIFDSEEGAREGEDYSQYNDVYLVRAGAYGKRASRTDPADSRTTVFYVAAPIYDRSSGEMAGTLTVSRPETAMAPFAEESRSLVLKASIITAVIVVVLGSSWAYWILLPVGRLTKEAGRIAAGRQASMPEMGIAEFRSLSIALENMRRELEGKHYVENYVQALTHELKSPLAAIRGAAELIDEEMPEAQRRRFLNNILTETSRSEDMVRRLVQLASIESQTSLRKVEKIDFAALVREELAELSSVVETKKLQLRADGLDEPQMLEGDPLMLRIAVRNVLNNAIDFTPEGGNLGAFLTGEEGKLILKVTDSGPGIPDYAEGRVFDRFYSLKNEVTGRKGSGIGLSFVRATMELHGGDAALRNKSGGGAEMELRFSV